VRDSLRNQVVRGPVEVASSNALRAARQGLAGASVEVGVGLDVAPERGVLGFSGGGELGCGFAGFLGSSGVVSEPEGGRR
jgi:hypothetical protein